MLPGAVVDDDRRQIVEVWPIQSGVREVTQHILRHIQRRHGELDVDVHFCAEEVVPAEPFQVQTQYLRIDTATINTIWHLALRWAAHSESVIRSCSKVKHFVRHKLSMYLNGSPHTDKSSCCTEVQSTQKQCSTPRSRLNWYSKIALSNWSAHARVHSTDLAHLQRKRRQSSAVIICVRWCFYYMIIFVSNGRRKSDCCW